MSTPQATAAAETSTPEPAILFRVDGGLARVTLNRPKQLNAINEEAAHLWRDIAAEIDRRDDIRAVLFDAVGRAFCAGGDVASMVGTSGEDVTALADVIHEGHSILRDTPKPIVAAVHGTAVGGGLGFMLVADHIVAAESAVFGSKYADIGLTPDCGVSTLLPEAIGMRRALQLTLSDRMLTASEAEAWGLVTETVTDDEVAARAQAVAQYWLDGATAAYGQAKRLLRQAPKRSYRESLDDEARTIGAAIGSPDAQARIAAFVAPRTR
ncbi:enoyl-CoA hydratase [Homoserinimonas aerilata]|uniref:Enoyl-CoA hydratase n=1 Tax=Homoserinimonas aerilata TaxID=1162970 RepID=A0A542YI80_9MICO|nr:enoyl-CoA hydratase/isomerase family protein [Homoserinimonas aerilata]TQL47768.1 enoyl-CoA hydratase [Homoserinimonas aerilata]